MGVAGEDMLLEFDGGCQDLRSRFSNQGSFIVAPRHHEVFRQYRAHYALASPLAANLKEV